MTNNPQTTMRFLFAWLNFKLAMILPVKLIPQSVLNAAAAYAYWGERP